MTNIDLLLEREEDNYRLRQALEYILSIVGVTDRPDIAKVCNKALTGRESISEKEGTHVQLVGPMFGVKDFNYLKFMQVAQKWRDMGFTVFNPAEIIGVGDAKDWRWFMKRNIKSIVDQDAIIILEGANLSKGSRWEMVCANEMGLGFYNESKESKPSTEWTEEGLQMIAESKKV